MKRLFRDMVGLFTRNWGLKILALTLAIVIYNALKPDEGGRRIGHDRKIFKTN